MATTIRPRVPLRSTLGFTLSLIQFVGAILYEMLSGRRAFRGESTADTMSAILREDPPDLSGTNRNINPALERVVNHCLEKNPEERFNSASDLAFAIEALSGSAATSEGADTILSALPPAKRKPRNWLPWSMVGVFLISTAVLAWLYFRRSSVPELPVRFVIAMPEEATEVSNPVISPDGRMIAFLGMYVGKRYLYTRQLNSLETQRLTGTEDAIAPFWSPDSRYLAFLSNNKLKKIEVSGGAPQTLCETPSMYGGTWNRDGVILVGLDTKGISRVSAAGGTLTPVLAIALLLLVGAFAGYFRDRHTGDAIDSIAVLPFENRSGDADTEYLSDGLAESLIYRLSQLPNLKVSPTSLAFRYKGKQADAAKVGNELGVSAVLLGRITQRGDNLTISAELVDFRNSKLLWGEQYDRKMSDLLATQRQIAREIVEKLKLKVSGNEKAIAKHYTESNEAYQLN